MDVHNPVRIPKEAYISEEYARAEDKKLWSKVWQVACREEEISEVGEYVTYDILDESIIVVRSAPDRISAFFNVCQHRGRRLTAGCGHAERFTCGFHGWKWGINGENIHVFCEEEFGPSLDRDELKLTEVKVDIWGGYVFINMDPDCEPLSDYLEIVPERLDPFEIDKMRYRWRQWTKFPCNWKIAIEAFNEGYHAAASHPQLTKYSAAMTVSEANGRHSHFGIAGASEGSSGGTAGGELASDLRTALAESLATLWNEINTSTTQTIVDIAQKLKDELPEGTPPADVVAHLNRRAMEVDAARGVFWPNITAAQFAAAGIDWHIFPNSVVLPGPTFVLGYRARPDGFDPNSCIMEVYSLERFADGEEPEVENIFVEDLADESWRRILMQDFANMGEVQRGMKSRGFRGSRPNPVQERPVSNFHHNLASYMGIGKPQLVD